MLSGLSRGQKTCCRGTSLRTDYFEFRLRRSLVLIVPYGIVIQWAVLCFFRFDELKELSSNRQSQLEDSLGLHQFFYEIEMEMAWIREHMTLATSEDLGTSLIGVKRLQKRHLVNHFFK